MSAVDGAQAQFAVDALVWAPHPTEYVVAARVVDEPLVPGEPGTVRIVPDDGSPGLGATLHLTAGETSQCMELDEQVLDPALDDLIELNNLTHHAVLHKLRLRFRARPTPQIYTNVSSILVSVNPFERLPLYGDDVLARYMARQLPADHPLAKGGPDAAYHEASGLRLFRDRLWK